MLQSHMLYNNEYRTKDQFVYSIHVFLAGQMSRFPSLPAEKLQYKKDLATVPTPAYYY